MPLNPVSAAVQLALAEPFTCKASNGIVATIVVAICHGSMTVGDVSLHLPWIAIATLAVCDRFQDTAPQLHPY